jgi:hypothetical protein
MPLLRAKGTPVKTKKAYQAELKAVYSRTKIRAKRRGTTRNKRLQAEIKFSNCPSQVSDVSLKNILLIHFFLH